MLFSKKVGDEGKVFAVDIATPFLATIHKKAEKKGIKNIETILCSDRNARLKKNAADIIFICDTYHHFEFPKSTLASIHKTLKNDGRLIVIDFERIEGKTRDWLMNQVRAGKEIFRAEIQSRGKLIQG